MLKQTYKGEEVTVGQYDVLPKGVYEAKIAQIGEWKPKEHQTLKVYEFDSSNRKVQDHNGKDVTRVENNVTTYSSQIIFEVTSGDYKGARIYYYLNLHPNQPWALPAFLGACGITDDVSPLDVGALCDSLIVSIVVDVEERVYKKTDKVTGATIEEMKEQNTVKRIKALDLA